jgi:ubiquinone/menaquinone biosynthesis C-methylase UbiE
MDNNTVYEWILKSTFTLSARAKSFQAMQPYLSSLVQPGVRVLDLCCGAGPLSFWLEELGATVTGMDVASYMIAVAKEEAVLRNSTVEFIEADIFTQDFRQEHFDLVTCFDSISDFPPSDFAKLGSKIACALKPGGRFVVQYYDGSYPYMKGDVAREGVYQETPERITFRFKEYLPDYGAFVKIIRNETRREEYERKGYIYTVPMVQLALFNTLELEQHIVLGENHFLDVFRRLLV